MEHKNGFITKHNVLSATQTLGPYLDNSFTRPNGHEGICLLWG